MYDVSTPQPKPARKWKPWQIVVLAVIALAGALCCIGVAATAGSDKPSSPDVVVTDEPTFATATTPAKPSPAAPKAAAALTEADIRLTVKTTKKSCFGSAGCNVEWEIRAAVTTGKVITDDYVVTFEIRGLEDPQTSQITLHPDGTYSQDPFMFGQTASSSKKLTAVVTDLEKA